MRVLVTGGAGFVGGHVALLLAEKGYGVVALDNLERSSAYILTKLREADVPLVVSDLRESISCAGFDAVVHAAAYIDVAESIEKPLEYLENNALVAAKLAKACRDSGVELFIYLSSAAVYGEPVSLPVKEDHPTRPISPYGLSKLMGEQVLEVFSRIYKLGYITLRLFNVYGPGQSAAYAGVIAKFVERVVKGLPPVIWGDGAQTRDFVHVRDVARAVLASLERGLRNEVVNIASGKPTSILELAELVVELGGLSLKPVFDRPRPGDVKHSYADITKARKLLGFQPLVNLREGVQELLEIAREQASVSR